MPVKIERFAGLMPKVAPNALPDGCAQTAQNCDITSGALKKYSAPALTSLPLSDFTYNDANARVIAAPPKPIPYVRPFWYLSNPYDAVLRSNLARFSEWFSIGASLFQYRTTQTGQREFFPGSSTAMTITNVRHTEDGLDITCTMNPLLFNYWQGGPYTVAGPLYRMGLFANGTYPVLPDKTVLTRVVSGGPALNLVGDGGISYTGGIYPRTFNADSPRIPQDRIPLYQDGDLYATMEVVRIDGPNFDTQYWQEVINYTFTPVIEGIHVYINMNYVRPSRLHVTYVTCARLTDEREGPPSPESDEIHVPPGAWPVMVFPRNANAADETHLNIYRSSSGKNGYRLLSEDYPAYAETSNTSTHVAADTKLAPLGDELPPFGKTPADLQSIILHPAQFAIGFKEKTVYPSDLYKPHVYPEEWSITFQEGLQQLIICGSTILAFTTAATGKVYALHGSNPETLSKSLLSDTAPLLNTKSLARIGSDVYWVTKDGIAKCNGSSVEIITSKHYTRETWEPLSLEDEQMYVADNTLILGTLKLDLDEDVASVSTLNTGAVTKWRSKDYVFEQPETIEHVRVEATGAVTARLYNESGTASVATISILNGNWTPVTFTGEAWGRNWSIEIEFSADVTVRSAEMLERQVFLMDGPVLDLDPSKIKTWRKFYVKFPHLGVLSGISIAKQPHIGTINVKVTCVDTGATETLPLTYGLGMPLFQSDSDNLMVFSRTSVGGFEFRSGLWMIECLPEGATDAGDFHIDHALVFARESRPVQGDTLVEINDGRIPPWLTRRYQFEDRVKLRSIAFNARAGRQAKVRLYVDGSPTPVTYPTDGAPLVSGDEISLRGLNRVSALEFDFNGADDDVLSVTMYFGEAQMVGPEGVFMSNSASWTGKFFKFPDRGTWACFSLGADTYHTSASPYPNITLYGDGGVAWPGLTSAQKAIAGNVTNGHIVPLPRTLSEQAEWELEIDAKGEVRNLVLMPRTRFQVDGKVIHEIAQDTAVPPWMFRRYEFVDRAIPKSFKVHADSAVKMRVYLDGSVTANNIYTIGSSDESLIMLDSLASSIEFDFVDANGDPANHLVNEVFIFMREGNSGDENGIHIRNRTDWQDIRFYFRERVIPACVALDASKYTNAYISLTGSGGLVHTPISGQYAHAVSLGYNSSVPAAADWSIFAVSEGAEIYGADAYMWRREKMEKMIHLVARTGEVPVWMYTNWDMPLMQRLRSISFRTSAATVVLRVWQDETAAPTSFTLASGEHSLSALPACSSFHFDFNGQDHLVSEAIVFAQESVMMGDDGYHVEEPIGTRMQMIRTLEESRFGLMSIHADAQAVVNLYSGANTTAAYTNTVKDDKWFLVPRTIPKSNRWTLDVECAGNVRGIHGWPRMVVPVEGHVIREVYERNAPPPWLRKIYKLTGKKSVRSMRVIADGKVDINFYRNGADDATWTADVDTDRELSVKNGLNDVFDYDLSGTSTIEFDFDGNDHLVREVQLFCTEEVPVPQDGLIIRGQDRLSWRNMILQFPNPASFAAGRVVMQPNHAINGSIVLNGYEVAITANDFVIDIGEAWTKGREWPLDVQVAGDIAELHLYAQNPVSLSNGRVVVKRDSEPWTWLNKAIVCEKPISLSCGRIYASGTVVFKLINEAGTVVSSQLITSSRPFRIPKTTPCRRWRFSVEAPADVQVQEVGLATWMGGLSNV